MADNHILIFDIGKTNKKLFLFDQELNIVLQENQTFNEIEDDDGFPCDDLQAILKWIRQKTEIILDDPGVDLKAINFSTYGASLVHLDQDGNIVGPFYNYLKPFDKDLPGNVKLRITIILSEIQKAAFLQAGIQNTSFSTIPELLLHQTYGI